MKKNYEIMLILDVQLTENEQLETINTIKEVIAAEDGEVKTHSDLGVRRLAYLINKKSNGHYHLMEFEGDTLKTIPALKNKLKFMTNVLRYLLVIKS